MNTQIDSNLGYSAVQKVLYDNKKPNRISIDFVEYKTKNAERIELFVNGRESESIVQQLDSNIIKDVFRLLFRIRHLMNGFVGSRMNYLIVW